MKKIITSTILLCALASSLNAQDPTGQNPQSKAPTPSSINASVKKGTPYVAKILTVDLSELYSKYTKAVEAQEKFDQAAENAQKEINEMMQEGVKLGETYKELHAKANNPALSDEAKRKFMEEANLIVKSIEDQQIKITNYQQQASQTLAQRRQSVMSLHMNDIKAVCDKIAKEKGANLVLNTTGILVMYNDPSSDITEEAINALNSQK